MKITDLRLRELTGVMEFEGDFWEERLSRPIDVYPEHKAQPASVHTGVPRRNDDGTYRIRAVYLEIDTDEGVTGLGGPVAMDVAYIIDQAFRKLLIGEDPTATERLWDKMYREAVHGRKGPSMMAISAIDATLWDLKGKWLGQPVYKLLGGPMRESIPAYASMLGHSLETDLVRKRARWVVDQGYTATKWFPRYGPVDGRAGMKKNVELIAAIREVVGPDVEIMIDAWMSWTVAYTLDIAEQLKEFRPRWIEEPVQPDNIAACAEIQRRSPIPTATGEHEYTRWGQKELMDARAADLLQPDTYWAGGISELMKIAAMAQTYDLPVIPHGHSVPANIHLSCALPITTVPYVEFLVKWNQVHQFFFTEPVVPVDGMVTVPKGPGMGMTLDEGKITSERILTWVERPAAVDVAE